MYVNLMEAVGLGGQAGRVSRFRLITKVVILAVLTGWSVIPEAQWSIDRLKVTWMLLNWHGPNTCTLHLLVHIDALLHVYFHLSHLFKNSFYNFVVADPIRVPTTTSCTCPDYGRLIRSSLERIATVQTSLRGNAKWYRAHIHRSVNLHSSSGHAPTINIQRNRSNYRRGQSNYSNPSGLTTGKWNGNWPFY